MKRKIAAINEDGFCFTVGEFDAGYELQENQIDVSESPDVLGKYYQDGAWTAPAPAEPQMTTEEMLAEVLLSTEYTACLLEEQMENA